MVGTTVAFGYRCQEPDCRLRFWRPDGSRECPRCDSRRTVAFGAWPAELHDNGGRLRGGDPYRWCYTHLNWEAA